jgi:4-aminobutyrate aminotransferase-like enzyme
VLGKSLGGGIVPISAVVGRREVIDALPVGSESETFACTPLAAAVGLEVLDQLTNGPWLARGREVGMKLRESLKKIGHKHFPDMIIEGQGASAVGEFVDCGTSLVAAQELARRIALACRNQGLLVHFTGPLATRIVLLPPLTTSNEELADGIERLTKAFALD